MKPVPPIEDLLAVRIDKSSPTPVYLQIADAVRTLLKTMSLAPGAPLPPERVVCGRVGVSKMTLRQAYGILEREGVIDCRRGVGTFVSQPRVDKKLPEMRSFTEEMAARGRRASSRLIQLLPAAPSFQAREFFGLGAGETVYRIQRLRLADDRPIALETVETPLALLPNLERAGLESQSFYRVLENRYGIQLGRCREEISAAVPDRQQRTLLEIQRGVAVLVILRKSYAVNAAPVELSVTAYRGDLYTASLDATRAR